MYVNFRLNETHDRDIIHEINKAKNKSDRIKQLLRKGILYENVDIRLIQKPALAKHDDEPNKKKIDP